MDSKYELQEFKNPTQNQHNIALINQYLINLERLNKSPHTILNYRADLEKFSLWLFNDQKMSLEKVNGEVIGRYKDFLDLGGSVYQEIQRGNHEEGQNFISWFKVLIGKALFRKANVRTERYFLFQQSPMSVSSKRRHLSSIKNFYEYLKEIHEDTSKLFEKNPVKSKIHAVTLKEIDVIPTPMINKEDFKKIDEATYRTDERLILYLLYFGGLRLSELTSLKVSNFDFKNKSITFNRKGGYVHTLLIQKEEKIFKNLNYYLEHKTLESEFLFHNNKGLPLTSKAVYNKIIKIIERAIPQNAYNQQISPHSFRKACATNLYLKSKDLLYVRDYLNHKDAKVTQTYIDKATLALVSKRYH